MTQIVAITMLSKYVYVTVAFMELGNNVTDVIAPARPALVLVNAQAVLQAQILTVMEYA